MVRSSTREVGIVLEGGGARGAYQIGAWKALVECGIHIKGVVGTSVGALNGALMVQGDLEQAIDLWENITYSTVIDVDDEIMTKLRNQVFDNVDMKHVFGQVKNFIKNNGFNIDPMKETMARIVDESAIRNKDMDFGLVTFNVSELKPMEIFLEDIEENLLNDYLLASSYLPVFKTEKLHGKYYLDGGVYNNLPVQMLIDRGYKDIIVIRIHGTGIIQPYKAMDDVMITYIEPKEKLGGILEFEQDHIANNINLGYYDALRVLNSMVGEYYFITSTEDELYYMNRFLDMPKRVVTYLIKEYGVEELSEYRNIYEFILPQLAKNLGLGDLWDYKSLYIAIYEYVAKLMNIERFESYQLDEFTEMVKSTPIVAKDLQHMRKGKKKQWSKVLIHLCKNW